MLKVVLLGEQSGWNWLVFYKPYTPLFYSLRAVTWSVAFWRLIQRKLLTWPQVLKSLVHLRTKHQPCLVNTQPCTHLGSCPFPSLFPHSLWMLLSLVYFLPWGPLGLSLEESSQMMALGEGLLSGCSMSNIPRDYCLHGFRRNILIGRFINWIQWRAHGRHSRNVHQGHQLSFLMGANLYLTRYLPSSLNQITLLYSAW